MGSDGQTKKELVDVGGRAIIWHVMRIFAAYGHTHFVLTLGHMAREMKRYFLELDTATLDFTLTLGSPETAEFHSTTREIGWRITLADTGLSTDKAARILRVAPFLEGADRFFVTYGDGVGNIDLDALVAFHHQHGCLATITGVHPVSQYGVAQVDTEGRVLGFQEKPQLDHWINGGFMLFERGVLDYLRRDSTDLERVTLTQLAYHGQLMMYRHDGFWRSMDTFKEAQELDTIWRECAPWKVW
jgi:glucose-1-phosphate cytidylyltransferase